MDSSFDPIAFLGIEDVKNREKVSKELMTQISSYLTTRFLEILPTEQIIYLDTQEKVFDAAKKAYIDFDAKIRSLMEDFKAEFQQQYKTL